MPGALDDDHASTRLGPYRAVDHVFAIDVDGDDDTGLGRLLEPLLSESATEPDAVYRIRAATDDEPGLITLGPDRAPTSHRNATLHQLLISHIGQQAIGDRAVASLHAVALRRDGVTLALAGPSRAGKSTVAARLLQDGWALLAEDIVAFTADGHVIPYPRPIGLTPISHDLLGIVPWEDCRCGKLMVHPADLADAPLVTGEHRIDVIVLVDREDIGFTKVSPGTAFQTLAKHASAYGPHEPAGFELIAGTIARAATFRLDTSDLDVAADLLGQVGPRTTPLTLHEVDHFEHSSIAWLDYEAVVSDRRAGQLHHLNGASTLVLSELLAGNTVAAIAAEFDLEPARVAEIADHATAWGLA